MTVDHKISKEIKPQTEVTLKELIIKIRSGVSYLISKWHLFCFICLLSAIVGYFKAYKTKPTYTGKMTFVLAGDNKNTNGFMSIASQFGIDNSGSSGADVFKVETIFDYMKSFYVIKKVFYKKISGSDSIFVNLFAKELKLDKTWGSDKYVKNYFPFPASEGKLKPIQDSMLRELHVVLIDNFIELNRPSKLKSFYEASTTSENEIIAANLPKYLVDETTKLYVETQTAQSLETVNMLQHQVDSLSLLLGSSINDVATTLDKTFNLNPALQVRRSSSQKKQINVSAITSAYGQLTQNLQMAKLNLQKDKPLFKIIDAPEIPLKIIRARKIVAAVSWAFIGGILLTFYLGIKFAIKNI